MSKGASRGLMIYLKTLSVAMDDGIVTDDEMSILNILITGDEMSMLDCLRRAMALQPDEHALVEEAVRTMIENFDDERLMSRLESYLTINPST